MFLLHYKLIFFSIIKLGPTLANLFMSYHENKWLNSKKGSTILFYKRFVDDMFCRFKSETDAKRFLTFLNEQHPNIKFTT